MTGRRASTYDPLRCSCIGSAWDRHAPGCPERQGAALTPHAVASALAAGTATVVVCDGSDAWERASARDRAAATRAAADAGWDWQPEPGVPSPAEAMLEVVASVRASDAESSPS